MDATDSTCIKGKYRFLSLTRDLLPHEVDHARRYVRGDHSLRNLLPIAREHTVTNLVPAAGRAVLARRLAGDTTYTGAINYGGFGSGSAAFGPTSTQLNTEVFRKLCSGTDYDGPIAYIDWYIATADVANQTFNEFGAFIDGTGTANSGQAISLLLTGGWVKSGAMFVSLSMSVNG